jgi:hypothetical protein
MTLKNRLAGIGLKLILVMLLGAVSNSCTVSYSFTGTNLPKTIQTFSVDYFPNRAKLVNPNLSQQFTEALKEKITKQTKLNEDKDTGDLVYTGSITGYDVKPIAIQKEDVAAQNRLTITINLKYTNNKDHEQDFEKSFTAYEDFDSSSMLSAIEDGLVPEIIQKILDDIFNATIAVW